MVYEIAGLLLPDPSWHQAVLDSSPQRLAEEAPRMPAGRGMSKTTSNLSLTIPIKFVICSQPGVTNQQIQEQVDILNDGFAGGDRCMRETGSNTPYEAYGPQYADTNIQFSLDQADITHVSDSRCSRCYSNLDALTAAHSAWEPGMVKVLVCDDPGILGAASFPEWQSSGTRELFIGYATMPGGSFAAYNEGKTLTHEMGHYLGLYHTFQGGCSTTGDSIGDTNSEESPFFGCPSSSGWRRTCQSHDPVHNFMDYSNDGCMCTFTSDQKEHMWDDIETYMGDIYDLVTSGPPPPPTPPPTPAPAPTLPPTRAPTTTPPTPTPCFEQDVSYRPYLQTPKLRTAGAVECLARCQDHVGCSYFSFHPQGRCFFAAASAWPRSAQHFVTGSATCALPPTAMPTPVPTRPPTHSNCFARDVSFRPYLKTPKWMTNNATECLNGCRDNAACKKFSFFSKEGHHYGRCFFAGDSAYMKPARHFVTGLQTCTPPA